MMRRARVLPFLLAATALPLACQAAPPGNARAKIDQYMQAAVKTEHFMGSVLVARGGHVIIAKGYGKANIKKNIPNTPETEFRIGSVTKQFTAMAILMLQDEGKLKVTDTVCKYVPACPKDWQPIRISNLLDHTSGIPDFTNFSGYMKVRSQSMTPTQLVALFKDKPLEFKPGTKFKYSNSGYVLLGYIIDRVSDEGYKQFLQQHIFDPLGMAHSGYGKSHPTSNSHAKGYRYRAGQYKPASFVNMTVPFSAGALYSTVRDLYTWDRALDANTGKLIPKTLHKKMFTPHVRVGGKLARIEGTTNPVHYGFGWFIKNEFGYLEYSHEGGIAGFTSLNSWFPKQHVYVIVLDNMTSADIFPIGKSLAAITFGKPYTIPQPFKAISLPAKALQKFVGMYQLAPKHYVTITRDGDQLEARLTGQPAADIYPETATHFFYKAVRAQIFFQTNDRSEVTGLVLHQNGMKHPAKKLSAAKARAVKARQAANAPKAISLPASALQKFVGTYQLAPDFTIAITRKGDQLSAQATGQPAFPIYPESKTEFFYKAVNAQITFVANDKGMVTKLILHQNGRNMPARKVE